MSSPTPDPTQDVWIRSSAEWPGGDGTEYVAYPRDEWEKLTDEKRSAELIDIAENTLQNSGCGAGASVVDLTDVPDSYIAEATR